MEEKVKKIIVYIMGIVALAGVISCGGNKSIDMDPTNDEFFRKTRLIMLKEEIKVYKHLPDQAAREEFIKEFWEKRDPNPETAENEAKIEFDARVEFIQRWFSEKMGRSHGLDSDRGKVYLLLGPPDERTTDERTMRDRFGNYIRVKVENWVYHYDQLFLQFIDQKGYGEYYLRSWPPDLLNAMEDAKFKIYSAGTTREKFEFKATYKDNKIEIKIPTEYINFDEKDGKMNASFKTTVRIYRENEIVNDIEKTFTPAYGKSEILKMKTIQLVVPCPVSGKGKFTFDIVVKDLNGSGSYRKVLREKSLAAI
jgi:GWxTD domain-containing protein